MSADLIAEISGQWAYNARTHCHFEKLEWIIAQALRDFASRRARESAPEQNAAPQRPTALIASEPSREGVGQGDAQKDSAIDEYELAIQTAFDTDLRRASTELKQIHAILQSVATCPPVDDTDSLTVRYLKDLCHSYNSLAAKNE